MTMGKNYGDGIKISKLRYYTDWAKLGFPKRKGKGKAYKVNKII